MTGKRVRVVNNNMREDNKGEKIREMKSMRRLVPSVARQTALLTDTALAVQSSVAVLVTQHLMTKMTATRMSSGKTVARKVETGEFGKWMSCVIAVFRAGAGIREPAQARPGTHHVLPGASDGAQPLSGGPQPWESRRMGCVERRMLR